MDQAESSQFRNWAATTCRAGRWPNQPQSTKEARFLPPGTCEGNDEESPRKLPGPCAAQSLTPGSLLGQGFSTGRSHSPGAAPVSRTGRAGTGAPDISQAEARDAATRAPRHKAASTAGRPAPRGQETLPSAEPPQRRPRRRPRTSGGGPGALPGERRARPLGPPAPPPRGAPRARPPPAPGARPRPEQAWPQRRTGALAGVSHSLFLSFGEVLQPFIYLLRRHLHGPARTPTPTAAGIGAGTHRRRPGRRLSPAATGASRAQT